MSQYCVTGANVPLKGLVLYARFKLKLTRDVFERLVIDAPFVLCCSCNRLNWGALDAWSSAPQLSLLQLSCTLCRPHHWPSYPTDSTILLLTSYLPIKTLVSRQQSTSAHAYTHV